MKKQAADIEIGTIVTISKTHISGSEEISGRQKVSSIKNDAASTKRTWFLHFLVLSVICGYCVGIGYAVFASQRIPQLALFQAQFDGTVTLLGDAIRAGLKAKVTSSRLLGNIYKYTMPYSDNVAFPELLLPGYAAIAKDVLTLGTYTQLYWMPKVNATHLAKFKSWAKKHIFNLDSNVTSTLRTINHTLNTYGLYYKPNATSKAKDILPIPLANPRFNQWMFPLLQLANLNEPVDTTASSFFFDPHSTPMGGRQASIDRALNASICSFTDFLVTVEDEVAGRDRPASIFYTPVYSVSSKYTVIGIVGADTYWDTIILNSLPNNVQRVDCVLSSKTSTWTISIDQGVISVDGHEGDYHDTSMSPYGQSLSLDLSVGGTIAASDFTITIYPSTAYYNEFITFQPIRLSIILAVVVFFVSTMLYVIRTIYTTQQERRLGEKERWAKAEEEARHAQENIKKAELDRVREFCLRHELEENLANSAHDMKSPTTALGLAVDSLLDTLDNNEPVTETRRKRVVETLHGMMHTISALTMIINRSVDVSNSAPGNTRGIIPNKVPVDLEKVIGETMSFMQWQADGSGVDVVLDSLPTEMPEEIMMDEKWLKDDLLCLASNAVKYSRSNLKVPAILRVAIVPSSNVAVANVPSFPMVRFSFIDSGYPLSDEMLTNLFNRPEFSERMQTGGMGLGLFCLNEHIKALQGQCGALRRKDGIEGTEIWFSIPLILPEVDLDQFLMSDDRHHIIKTVNSTTINSDGKSLFSSPQNRRSSVDSKTSSLEGASSYVAGADCSTKLSQRSSTQKKLQMKSSLPRKSLEDVLGKLPILIVDDSVSILKMTKKAIQNECANISFIEAKNGEEAFERVAESLTSFELIITDIQMPVCNGFDFTRKVRQLEKEKGLTPKLIIGISANDQQKIAKEAEESGMDALMHKPFKLSMLMDVIEEISKQRKQTLRRKYDSCRSNDDLPLKQDQTSTLVMSKQEVNTTAESTSTTLVQPLAGTMATGINENRPESTDVTVLQPLDGSDDGMVTGMNREKPKTPSINRLPPLAGSQQSMVTGMNSPRVHIT